MANPKTQRHWLRVILIVPLIVAFSFTSVALAQTDGQQQTGQGEEMAARNFASVEQRMQVRDRDLRTFDNDNVRDRWCNNDDWIVREGESLGHIVLNCNISMAHILAVNPQISNPDLLYIGEIVRLPDYNQRRAPVGGPGAQLTLTAAQRDHMQGMIGTAEGAGIPVTGADAQDIGRRNIASGSQRQAAMQRDYDRFENASYRAQWCGQDHWIVNRGESLSHLIMRCGYSLEAILSANPQISNANIVLAGEMINIPTGQDQAQPTLTEDQRSYVDENFDTTPPANDG
jgi:N-acetylmuramoyl-L-alanine amidase